MAIAILISISCSAYLMFTMIKHIDLTSCRIDTTSEVILYGSSSNDWNGL